MKKLFTILLLSVCFVSVPSCQKDSNGKGDDPNRLTSKEAKEYFEQNSTCLRFLSVGGDKPSGTKSALTENMIIDWDSAIESETSDAYFVEVPINMSSPISANLYDGIGHMHKNIRPIQVNMSLLIERHKSDDCTHCSVVTTIGSYSNNTISARYCYSSNKSSFSGYQIFSKEDGTYTTSKIFKNGRFVENALTNGCKVQKVDSTGKDLLYSGIQLMSSRALLTKGDGGGGSGEDCRCPYCGSLLLFQNGFLHCPICNLDLDDWTSAICPDCLRPISDCDCSCPICGYPNRYGNQCMCQNPSGERCPYCGVYGCNGQCGGGADSTGTGDPNRYFITLNVNNVNGGYVTRNPDRSYYFFNESVTLTAYPYSGYSFSGWYEEGFLISQLPTLLLDMNQDRTILAVFEGI